VRKLLTWLLVTFGIAALVRRLRRRSRAAEPSTTGEDPAGDLRRKLAESRAEEEPEEPPAPEATVEERRAAVHEEARTTLDEIQGRDEQ
jgi:hypothetical protein